MPDGQSGVLEKLDGGVNAVSLPLTAPIAVVPQYERPSYELETYKWGNGTRGTAGGTITWAVVTAGQSIPTDSEYTSAVTAISSVFMPSIRQAFSRWDEVGNFTFVETTSPSTANIVLVFDELQAQSAGTIGLANTWYSGSVIRNSYISFDLGRRYRLIDGSVQIVGSSPASGTADFYTLVLHEVGHALGLDHENDMPTVMNASQNSSVTDLTSDDIAGIRAVYGSPGTIPTIDDYPADATTTASVTVGGTATGRIDTNVDEDWFRVNLTAGVSYRFDLRGYDSSGGTLLDPYMRLLSPTRTELVADDDSGTGTDSQILYTATTTGTYYIAATGFGGEQGTYTVAVATSTTADDYTANSSTTGAVAVGGSVTGRLETSTDADWFAVTLTAGQSYRIDLRGSASGGGTLADPYVRVKSSSGVTYGSDDDSGTGLDAQLTYTAAYTGVHYIEAAAGSSGTGTYTLSVAPNGTSGDDYTATTATSGVVTVGGTLSGSIGTAGDIDWVRVSLTAGTLYRFDARGSASSGGSLTDPALQLLNSSGTVLVADNDSGAGADARLMFRASVSGTYYLAMRSNSSAATGTYTIAAASDPDDYAANTGTAGTVAVGGTAEGLIETAGDRDWFRTTLTANTTYTIRVSGTATGSALRWTESQFYVRNGSGFQLATASSSGLGASAVLNYTPSATGTYIIDALAYSTGIGSYSVSVAPASAATAEGLTADDLAAVMAPPAIALDALPLQLARSSTVFVDDTLSAILTPAPSDLFSPPAEQQTPFMANTPFDPLFQQQFSNSYNLLPF
ncbi:MAG: pre-peptidase C-terminal domain-containing protein [Rhodospirillaceae bacterium]